MSMSHKKDRIDTTGAGLLIAFSALLGLNQVCIKLVNTGLSPAFQAGLRSVCAFVVVLIFATIMRRRLSLSDGSLIPGVIIGILFGVEFLLLFQALDYISVSRTSILFYTMPFWVAIAAHFIIPGERVTRLKSFGLLLALAGVLITLSNNTNLSADLTQAYLGDIFCLLAATAWAAIAIICRTTKLQVACPEMQLLYQLGISAPILLGAAAIGGEYLREPTTTTWLIFAFQVLVVVSIGFLTWFWVLSIYPVANMAVFSFLAPVFGVFFGWLILSEELTAHLIIALSLIAIGIMLVNWPVKRIVTEEST